MWDRVKEVLQERIIEKMQNPDGEKWLQALDACEGGRQLGVCIAIDLLSGAVETESFIELLDTMDFSETSLQDACTAFGKALLAHAQRSNFLCASLFKTNGTDSSDDDDSYLRVLSLVAFMEYYAIPTWPGLTTDEAGQRKFRNMFFNPWQPPPPLGMIKETWGGPNGIVWVTSYKEYENLIDGKPKNKISPTVNDVLGINHPASVFLLGVKYPKDFASAECCQPTSLDAGWVKPDSLYVSYRKYDNWGRTHSCTGSYGPARERVHREFDGGLTNEYQLIEIGEVTKLQVDRDKLLSDAFRRVQMLFDAQELEAHGPES